MTPERRPVADFFADMRFTRVIGETPFYGIRLRVPELRGASGEKDNSGRARTLPRRSRRSFIENKEFREAVRSLVVSSLTQEV